MTDSPPKRELFKFFKGIKVKLTAAITGAVLATALLLTVVTVLLVSYTVKLSLDTRAVETSKIISEGLLSREHLLSIRTEMIAQDEGFQTAYSFRTSELERLDKELSERVIKAGGELGLVADLQGNVVTTVAHHTKVDAKLLQGSVALKKVRVSNTPTTTIEGFGEALFFVAAVPIKQYDVQTLGYVVVAAPLSAAVLGDLKLAAGADLLLVQDGLVRAGTFTLESGKDSLKDTIQRLSKGDHFVPVKGLSASEGALLSWAIPLDADGKLQGALVFALSAKENATLQKQLVGSSLGFTLLVTLLSAGLALFIARRIADPIVEIEYSFREIAASGDLSRRIDKPYADEVGQMAASFNLMQHQIEGLHGRVVAAEHRMRDELKTASAVQEMLFPSTSIDGSRCQFASHSQASSETGGDWYTIIHSPELHVTTIIVSDVTGHGAAAALVTAIFHGFFKATQAEISRLTPENWQPGIDDILKRLNTMLIESTRRSLVSSLFLFTFDHRTMRARYANAGHPSPLYVAINPQGKSQVGTLATAPSSLIGDVDAPEFSWGEHQFAPEQLFVLYTDGLIECTDTAGEMYGFKRLRGVLQQLAHQDARTVRDTVMREALAFFGDMTHADDITVIVGRTR